MIPATLRRGSATTFSCRILNAFSKRTVSTLSDIQPTLLSSPSARDLQEVKPSWHIVGLPAQSKVAEKDAGRNTEKDASGSFVFPNVWLRDNCQCHECIHPDTKQRQFDTFSEPPSSARNTIDDCRIKGPLLKVTWQGGHESEYSTEWLKEAFDATRRLPTFQGHVKPRWWATAFVGTPPEVPYEAVMSSDDGVKDWTRKIREYGFCFVDGCPPTPEATKALLERIGPIRETHYGGFYDFTSDLSSKDTAYTSLALDVHTDTTYFTEPAGLQMFHLLSHTDGHGGSTQLVDGFRAASELHNEDAFAYSNLSTTQIMAHASGNEGISIQPQSPLTVFKHDSITGELEQVRWNNADRGAFFVENPEQAAAWYDAAFKLSTLMKKASPEMRYEAQMVPGRPLIFDNWRVLHGRSAFTGKRRISGGYINRDDFISRYKMTNFGQDYIRKNGLY